MRATFLYSSALPSFGAREPAIALRIAQTWLVFGCLAVLCMPALRDRSEWLGWMPLWLIVVPAAQLLILRWRSLLAASHAMWRPCAQTGTFATRRPSCARLARRVPFPLVGRATDGPLF